MEKLYVCIDENGMDCRLVGTVASAKWWRNFINDEWGCDERESYKVNHLSDKDLFQYVFEHWGPIIVEDSGELSEELYIAASGDNKIFIGTILPISGWRKMLNEAALDDWKNEIRFLTNTDVIEYCSNIFQINLMTVNDKTLARYIKANIYPKDKRNFLNVHEIDLK